MKFLIIEGPDRVGKNTLIQKLTSQAENYVVRHFGSAKGDTNYSKRNYQFQFFKKEFELANLRNRFEMQDKDRYPNDIWIWNRGHLGEFVYGNLYRNTKPDEWIIPIEKMFGIDLDPSIYLLYLHGSPEFLCENDDGLSFSADIKKKKDELEYFKNAFEKSTILNKASIRVDDNNGNYINSDEIFNTVNNFLNNKFK